MNERMQTRRRNNAPRWPPHTPYPRASSLCSPHEILRRSQCGPASAVVSQDAARGSPKGRSAPNARQPLLPRIQKREDGGRTGLVHETTRRRQGRVYSSDSSPRRKSQLSATRACRAGNPPTPAPGTEFALEPKFALPHKAGSERMTKYHMRKVHAEASVDDAGAQGGHTPLHGADATRRSAYRRASSEGR